MFSPPSANPQNMYAEKGRRILVGHPPYRKATGRERSLNDHYLALHLFQLIAFWGMLNRLRKPVGYPKLLFHYLCLLRYLLSLKGAAT
jgi:hypothetical protein